MKLEYHRTSGFYGNSGALEGVQFSWTPLVVPPILASYDAVVMCQGIDNEYDGEGMDLAFKFEDQGEAGLEKAIIVDPAVFNGTEPVKVSFTVSNTGKSAGAEVAELYVGQQNPTIDRPIKELKGFQKVFLQPGESQLVTVELDQRSFAYFNTAKELWDAVPGTYNVLVGGSSQDTPLKGQVSLKSEFTSNP